MKINFLFYRNGLRRCVPNQTKRAKRKRPQLALIHPNHNIRKKNNQNRKRNNNDTTRFVFYGIYFIDSITDGF